VVVDGCSDGWRTPVGVALSSFTGVVSQIGAFAIGVFVNFAVSACVLRRSRRQAAFALMITAGVDDPFGPGHFSISHRIPSPPGVHGVHEIAPAASLRAACYLRIRPRPKTKASTQHNALTVLGMSAEAQMGD
jgi:hypothetical protein